MLKLCPTCHCDLTEVERMDVLVDVCSLCQGIWLDRGKLEKLSEHIRAPRTALGDERDSAPRFVVVYETALRVRRNLLDIFR